MDPISHESNILRRGVEVLSTARRDDLVKLEMPMPMSWRLALLLLALAQPGVVDLLNRLQERAGP